MKSIFDRLNLRPQERRLVVAVAAIVFVVLNVWLVWPHFKDWKIVQGELAKSRKQLQDYRNKIARVPAYEAKLEALRSQGDSAVADDQLDLVRTVQTQASQHNVAITRQDSPAKSSATQTNQFFEEQELRITISTGNQELVGYLVGLASTNSLIRVKDLDLRRDPSGFKLTATITFVASYAKKAPAAPLVPPSRTNVTAVPKPRANADARPLTVAAAAPDRNSIPLLK